MASTGSAVMIRSALRPCPVCSHAEAEVLHPMRFVLPEGSQLPDAYDIVACCHCCFVYADTAGAQADYDCYYTNFSHYEDASVATGGGDSDTDRERLGATAAWLATRLPHDARLLDIGCGNGGLLVALRERNFTRLAGLDPARGCVKRLRETGFEAWVGSLSTFSGADIPGVFDAILLSHVLEHIVDVHGALATLRDRLAPGGLLYVEAPDASRYVEHPFVPFYYFDSEHINHFDRTSLFNLGRLNGFNVIDCGEKYLPLPGGRRYPAVFALFSRNEGATQAAPAPSRGLRTSVEAYIAQSSADTTQDAALANLAASRHPVALWGAGSQAQRLLEHSPLKHCRIVAVVDRDRNKHGHIFAGRPVAAPESGLAELPAETVVVVAAALHADAILTQYRALGLPYQCLIPGAKPNEVSA